MNEKIDQSMPEKQWGVGITSDLLEDGVKHCMPPEARALHHFNTWNTNRHTQIDSRIEKLDNQLLALLKEKKDLMKKIENTDGWWKGYKLKLDLKNLTSEINRIRSLSLAALDRKSYLLGTTLMDYCNYIHESSEQSE